MFGEKPETVFQIKWNLGDKFDVDTVEKFEDLVKLRRQIQEMNKSQIDIVFDDDSASQILGSDIDDFFGGNCSVNPFQKTERQKAPIKSFKRPNDRRVRVFKSEKTQCARCLRFNATKEYCGKCGILM